MEKGIESFKAAVMSDCAAGHNCFSKNGCTHERHLYLPEDDPKMIAIGFKTKCIANTKCFHDYCGKYKWVLDRAAHYAEKSGKTVKEVIAIWENDRTYWYMNYYQDGNQPLLNSEKVIIYEDWITALKIRFGKDPKNWAFKCPACGNIQTCNDFIEAGISEPESNVYFNCIGRFVKGQGCNWTLGGLFSIHKVSVLKDAQVFPVFEMAERAIVN